MSDFLLQYLILGDRLRLFDVDPEDSTLSKADIGKSYEGCLFRKKGKCCLSLTPKHRFPVFKTLMGFLNGIYCKLWRQKKSSKKIVLYKENTDDCDSDYVKVTVRFSGEIRRHYVDCDLIELMTVEVYQERGWDKVLRHTYVVFANQAIIDEIVNK